uniref:VWFA domain-containing protein n=1 Tax=Gouania willdenowi TaxID=441366 RepID=A0A8C5H705_GOUWI
FQKTKDKLTWKELHCLKKKEKKVKVDLLSLISVYCLHFMIDNLFYVLSRGSTLYAVNANVSFSQKYKEFERAVRVEEIDGLRLVKRLAENMEEMFHKKAQRLVEAAEEAHLQHDEDPDLQYEYFNAVLINEVDEEGNSVELGGEFILQPNDHFNNLSVNLSLSVVQVPTNMYNKDSAIVNGVYWSEALNKVFVDNFEKDPSLIWQYFGSAKGFFRQYPGIKWKPDEHGVIAFDCRNRKWYIQAATSPKDVVILVDVSGSMKGLRLTIARQTVSSILDTLGDDDFFNIIAYNEELHYVEPCLNGTLVQADHVLMCHYFTLNMSLRFFSQIHMCRDFGGSECSQAIMLVTDGAVDTYDAIFAKYNWPDRKVRIFPYLIGRESAFAENLKWMACANKGYFTQISTLADVQENVMEYLHVLSRPKVIDQEHDTVWTEAYIDSTVSWIYSMITGPVLMTTVAMPVFSTKNETVSLIIQDLPSDVVYVFLCLQLGIHGYTFAITNNGYILTHPDLRPLYGDGKKRRKPNYSSVDLSEVEWEDKDDTLRNAMVNRKTGTFSMEVKKSVDKGKRVLVLHNDYYYTDIKGTPFSLGVALSRGHGNYMELVVLLIKLVICYALLCYRTYCNTDEHPEHRYLSQIEAIKLSLNGHEPHLQCDKELIQEVLFDAVVTAPLEAYWTSLVLNKSENSDKGVEIAYLGTRTGLSRINLFVVPDQLTNQDFLTAEDKEGVFNADHFPLWYKRAAEQVPGTFVYSLPFGSGLENKSVVLASTAIQLLDERKSPIAAAVGIQMKLEFFQRKFWTASRQCAAVDGKCSISCDDEHVDCYLIDNNGFILVSEDYTLVSLIFKILTLSRRLIHIWLLSFIFCFLFFLTFFSSPCLSLFLLSAQRVGRNTQVPCDTEYPAFVSERTIKENMGSIDCDGCFKSFVIQQIPSSNLFMVVTDNKCDCIAHNESLKCERLKIQKDRRRPDSCHPFHAEVFVLHTNTPQKISRFFCGGAIQNCCFMSLPDELKPVKLSNARQAI